MNISLDRNSEILLKQQLTEQIVFLISSGQLRAGEQLPSVRALARQLKIHHNTVSSAYQGLVRRRWLKGSRGSRLAVAKDPINFSNDASLDGLIDQTIQRARENGYSLQALRQKVLERLLAEPPDRVIVVEDEPELAVIIREEIRAVLKKPVSACSIPQFKKSEASDAQVVGMDYALRELKGSGPGDRPHMRLEISAATEHLKCIGKLKESSIVGIASVSRAFLKAAKGLLAPLAGSQHRLNARLVKPPNVVDFREADVVFCDSVSMPLVQCRKKFRYQLIAASSLMDIAAVFDPPLLEAMGKRRGGLK